MLKEEFAFYIALTIFVFIQVYESVFFMMKEQAYSLQLLNRRMAGVKWRFNRTFSIVKFGNLIRLFLALVLIGSLISKNDTVQIASLICLLIYNLLFSYQMRFSIDTSDIFLNLLMLGFIFFKIKVGLGIYFISMNLVTVYFFMGYNKLLSREWRAGKAVFTVMNTKSFGNETMAHFLYRNFFVSKILCWGIIILQLSFPVALFNPQLCILYIFLGILFHSSIMIFMRLHNFFFVFITAYPILYCTSLKLHPVIDNFING